MRFSISEIFSCFYLILSIIEQNLTQYVEKRPYKTCLTRKDALFAVKNDCTRFVRCFNGFRYDFKCPSGTVFDKVRRICNHPQKVKGKCSKQMTRIRQCTDANDLTPYPGDCTRFLRCANGILYEFMCPHGTVFDPDLRLCNYLSNLRVQCGINDFYKVLNQ